MKKISALLLTFLLVVLAGCSGPNNSKISSEIVPSDIVSSKDLPSNSTIGTKSESSNKAETSSKFQATSTSSKAENSSVTSSNKPESREEPSSSTFNKVSAVETSSSKSGNVETSSKKTDNAKSSSDKTSSIETSSNKTSSIETSSKEPTTTEPSVDTNPDNAPLEDTQSNVIGYTYAINGTIVDWFTEGELIHAVFKKVNRYAVFDTTTGQIVTDKALSGRPAEIHKFGDELWISYPDLQCIKIHDSKTFSVKDTISFTAEVSSFDVYGDYLIYTEDDQHVYAYRYNMKTQESVNIRTEKEYMFYQADVLVNSELGCVYIGEMGSTGSKLYCFDIETLALKAKYSKNNYGYMNHKRRTFLLGDYVYWGEFRLNAKNIAQIDGQYTGYGADGMLYVNETFVATTSGIYLNSTCEQIVSFRYNNFYSSIAITDSGNMIATERDKLYIFSQQK